MKFQTGQSVLLLDTSFKPAVNAIIKEIDTESGKYLIEFSFPVGAKPEQIWVPQERLSVLTDTVSKP
jgi:hypothetical protein